MNAHTIFVISAIIGWVGMFGFVVENISGRMTRFTRWKDMTTRQWALAYMMVQFAAMIVVMLLYHAVGGTLADVKGAL